MMTSDVHSQMFVLARNMPEVTARIVQAALVLIVLILFLGVVILILRRKSLQKDEESAKIVYSLHDLRQMLQRNEITQEEFEKLKDIVSTQTRKTGPVGRPPS